ncbi:hypothetical protein CP061683_1035A, partial [Chlamydia psittaci 06-1683]
MVYLFSSRKDTGA